MTSQQAQTSQAPPDELELASPYLPLERMHGISLRLQPEVQGTREGVLVVDPNTCQIDAWGDRGGCTRIALQTISIRATRQRTADPKGQGRVLWGVHGAELQAQAVHLVQDPAGPWMLVLERVRAETAVIPLFGAPRC